MATVINKGTSFPVDKKLSNPNRKLSGNPQGTVVPLYTGEIILDIVTGNTYYASDPSNTGWMLAIIGV